MFESVCIRSLSSRRDHGGATKRNTEIDCGFTCGSVTKLIAAFVDTEIARHATIGVDGLRFHFLKSRRIAYQMYFTSIGELRLNCIFK